MGFEILFPRTMTTDGVGCRYFLLETMLYIFLFFLLFLQLEQQVNLNLVPMSKYNRVSYIREGKVRREETNKIYKFGVINYLSRMNTYLLIAIPRLRIKRNLTIAAFETK